MKVNPEKVDIIGSIARSCMILTDENSIGIYMLGFHGTFLNYRIFINGEEKMVCQFCTNRAKFLLKECSLETFCFGYKNIPNKTMEPFDLVSLCSYLRKEGYSINENYRNGYLCYPSNKDEPIVTIHLIDIP